MERPGWKNLLEGVGIVALVASLLFVGFQLQQDRDLAAAQVIVAADAAVNEAFATISANSDVWLRGLKGEELSGADEIAFRAVATALFRRHMGMYQRTRLLGLGSAEGMAQQYAFDLYQYPSLRRIYTQESRLVEARNHYFNRAVNNGGFRTLVEEYLVELDKTPPEFQEKTFFPY